MAVIFCKDKWFFSIIQINGREKRGRDRMANTMSQKETVVGHVGCVGQSAAILRTFFSCCMKL